MVVVTSGDWLPTTPGRQGGGSVMLNDWKTRVARLFGVGAFICGLTGIIAGLVEREWRLAVTGWFTGGILLAVLAVLLLADAYTEIRRKHLS